MRRFLCIAVSLLLGACAQQPQVQLYSGSPMAQDQVLSVVVPSELEVQSINGQHVPAANGLFGNKEKTLLLQPGKYQINAFYKDVYDIDGGLSHEVVRGRTALYVIDGKGGELWRLDYSKPANLQEAQGFKHEFTSWAVNTHTKEKIAAKSGQRNGSLISNLLGSSGQPVSESSVVAPLGSANNNSIARQPASAVDLALPHNDATLSTLQQLWQMLGEDSRSAFLAWTQQ